MDEWGQGPWFDPEGQGQKGEPAGEQPAEANAGQPGEPADAANTDDLFADEVNPEDAFGPGTTGGFRMPPIPSRPLGPDRSYISGGPAGPGEWYSPPSGPYGPTLSRPLGSGGYSAPPGAAAAARGRDNGKHRSRAWLFLLAIALLVLAISSTAGLLTGYLPQLIGLGGPSINAPNIGGIFTPPTPTATSTPLPTPTPLVPTAATITFTTISTTRSSSGTMTSCPKGCNITGATYGSSKGFSGSYSATFVSQQHLFGAGAIHVTTNQLWAQSGVVFSGGGFSCEAVDVNVSVGSPADYDCRVTATSPSTLNAGTIHGTADNGHATFTQPIALTGDAHYTATSGDCSSAFSDLHSQGNSWASSWNAGLSIPGGWRIARGSPRVTYSNNSCPQGQTTASTFTASSTTNASNGAYNPGAAQSLASVRLAGTLPGGYSWIYSTWTTCSPSFKGVDNSNKVTLSCSDSGTAYLVWSTSAKNSLAGKIAGKSKDDALAICNKTSGVGGKSCSISIIGGNGQEMPASAGALTINPKIP